MAITTYSELKTSVADFLNRDDLTSVIADFIALGEAQMNRDIRHYSMIKRSVAEIDTRYSSLPTDFLEPIRLHIDDSYQTRLELTSLDDMLQLRNNTANATGKPQYYAIVGDSIEVYPTPDADYNTELMYYAKIDALSDSNTSNWVLSSHPDAYLYGSLMQSAPYLKDDNRLTVWASLYAGIISSINRQSERTKYGGSGIRKRIRSY
jgi:hypothetical protein